MRSTIRPDRFAVGLFLVGLVLLFVPLMVISGVVALVAAGAYWLTMLIVTTTGRTRS